MKENASRQNRFLMIGTVLIVLLVVAYFIGQGKKKQKEPFVEPVKEVEKFEVDFKFNSFREGVELSLLKELKICDTTKVGDEMGACSPKFFHFIPLNATKSLKNGFILLINGLAFADPEAKFPIRRTLVYEREKGVLVAVNKFKGNIIERRKVQGSNYPDIVMRFRLDQYDEKYHVIYTWKNNRYRFKQCEELYSYFNQGKVREELIDSVSREVQKILIEENLVY
jgi:5-hydroxyisourate hydrolase-like protein (transthyretin family)